LNQDEKSELFGVDRNRIDSQYYLARLFGVHSNGRLIFLQNF